jgi:hypothetical protein
MYAVYTKAYYIRAFYKIKSGQSNTPEMGNNNVHIAIVLVLKDLTIPAYICSDPIHNIILGRICIFPLVIIKSQLGSL